MALTLTETASLTKKGFVIGLIVIVLLGSAWIGLNWYINYQRSKIPPPQEKADTKFNLLPRPDLGQGQSPSSDYTYELVTETGNLPSNTPTLMKVYFISKLGTTLLSSDRAKGLAQKLEFDSVPEIINPTLYRFTDNLGGEMRVDLDTGNFEFTRTISTESATFQDEIVGDQGKIVSEFKSFLGTLGLLPEDLRGGGSKVFYNGATQQESDQAEVTLWQSDLVDDEIRYPIITKEFTQGLIKATVTKYTEERNKYLKLNYTYWSIDQTNLATYPIKNAETAFNELQEGKGVVVVSPPGRKIDLSSIYLAYLLSDKYTKYLQPIYVFEGDGFVALVPAIQDEYFAKEEATN